MDVKPWRLIFRGITRRCPRCGSGHLFRHWFTMVPDCPRCDYHFEREEGFFLGAYVINFAVTELATIVLIIVGFAVTLPDPPVGRLAVLGLVLSVALPVIGYPFSKTFWTACDMILRRSMGDSYSQRGSGDRQPGFDRGRTDKRG